MFLNRRALLRSGGTVLSSAFLTSMLGKNAYASGGGLDFSRPLDAPLAPLPPPYLGKAKRIIYLHMAGAPSQLEMFDYKPELKKYHRKEAPQSFLEGKRFAFISGKPKLLGPLYDFKQYGESGAWFSDRLPHLSQHADDMCFIKSMHTDQFNHAPAQILMHTGSAVSGNPSIGAWTTYGLGTFNQNLPGYVALVSGSRSPDGGKQLWGSGFLPSVYQGVQCRSDGDPVLYLSNPDGVSRSVRRRVLDTIAEMNQHTHQTVGDPETLTRTAQYEMAFRMQFEATNAFNIEQESQDTLDMYGAKPGAKSYANNCLVARRLAERGVRFIQLFDYDWDHHGTSEKGSLAHGFIKKCENIDKSTAALLSDLKRSGLLEDTLVVWTGEFGRTPMQENRGGQDNKFAGRDHHPDAFTVWMAGAGTKGGFTYGETDELGYSVAKNPVEIQDFHATLLYLLGFDHHQFTYRFQGLDHKLTGLKEAKILGEILA